MATKAQLIEKAKSLGLEVNEEMKNAEIEALIAAAEPPAGPGEPPAAKVIDLSGFDYKSLTGEDFKKYAAIVGDKSVVSFDMETGEETIGINGVIPESEMKDFECYRIEVVRKIRFAGVKDSPKDFNGVRVKTDKPEYTTRISVSAAHELNRQVLNEHSIAGHGRYYLLKK